MNSSQIFIAIAVIALVAIVALQFWINTKRTDKRLGPLVVFAAGFIVVGIFNSDNRAFGYSIIAFGLLLAAIDIFMKWRLR